MTEVRGRGRTDKKGGDVIGPAGGMFTTYHVSLERANATVRDNGNTGDVTELIKGGPQKKAKAKHIKIMANPVSLIDTTMSDVYDVLNSSSEVEIYNIYFCP